MKKQKINTLPFWRFLFLLYCAAMLWLLFGRSNGWTEGLSYREQLRQNANLIPFFTIKNYVRVLQSPPSRYLLRHCFINLAGNIFLFIPAGWLFPKIFPRMRNFFRFFTLCAGLILLVELVQLFTLLGSFDVDDVILNLFGMTVGFILFGCFGKAARRK